MKTDNPQEQVMVDLCQDHDLEVIKVLTEDAPYPDVDEEVKVFYEYKGEKMSLAVVRDPERCSFETAADSVLRGMIHD